MADILINKEDLPLLIESFTSVNSSFRVLDTIPKKGNQSGYTCNFILNGCTCKIDIYHKAKFTKIVPIGMNVVVSNVLIDYIVSKTMNANIETKQIVFPVSSSFTEEMKMEFGIYYTNINVKKIDNKYEFVGYNNDKVIIHQYNDKIMLQGKPLYVFSLIMDYIAQNTDIELENYYNLLGRYIGNTEPFEIIRNYMSKILGNSYDYIDEAIRKTLSSSITMLNQNKENRLEDYSGCITGAFKTLEGYLKKILNNKFHYKFDRCSFSMFKKKDDKYILINSLIDCSQNEENELCKLYTIFNNKRNTYLHAKINPALTSIIQSYMDAKSIFDEIIDAIRQSYNIIFGE